jgi:DNA-binding NarL/FixJ family response regulator
MLTVLICEDDPLVALDLAECVKAAGHEVLGVYASARAALAAQNAATPDLAIIDLSLADGDTGAMLAQRLQEEGTRVIIASGHSNVNVGLGSVPHTYACKPLSGALVRHLLEPSATDASKFRT